MQKIIDEGLLIHKRPFSESKAVVSIFTKEHGRVCGMLRLSKKEPLDIATVGKVTWNARLSDQLGIFTFEPLESLFQQAYGAYQDLLCLQSLSALLHSLLSERHPYLEIYKALEEFIVYLKNGLGVFGYIRFEQQLLSELGFALDLTECAVTKATDNLVYISPKSGRAVSKSAGLAYHDKLFPLSPLFSGREGGCEKEALSILGYFLKKHLIPDLPSPRAQLENILQPREIAS